MTKTPHQTIKTPNGEELVVLPRAELKRTDPPTKSHQIGVTCGVPSGIKVARLAKARFANKSWNFSGISVAMGETSLSKKASILILAASIYHGGRNRKSASR